MFTQQNKEKKTGIDLDYVEGEFKNEAINESFRESLMENSKTVKEIIVARALFGATNDSERLSEDEDFSDFEEEMDDYIDDPEGIAVPWEELHGKNKAADKD